jgi:hypothetical protein
LKPASGSLPKNDARAVTTLTVLYKRFQYLGWDQRHSAENHYEQPDVDSRSTVQS